MGTQYRIIFASDVIFKIYYLLSSAERWQHASLTATGLIFIILHNLQPYYKVLSILHTSRKTSHRVIEIWWMITFFIFRRFNCKLLPYARKGKQMDFKNCISRTIHTSIRSSDSHANESINRFVTPLDRQAELRVNKILVKLSQNELKQMASQLGEAIVRVQGEKRP